jgi:hypothetical protein
MLLGSQQKLESGSLVGFRTYLTSLLSPSDLKIQFSEVLHDWGQITALEAVETESYYSSYLLLELKTSFGLAQLTFRTEMFGFITSICLQARMKINFWKVFGFPQARINSCDHLILHFPKNFVSFLHQAK